MILKRLGAIALAVILVGGAWLIRDRVIDDDGGSGNDDPPRADREIVCVSRTSAKPATRSPKRYDLDIRIEDAATTLDALAALEDPSEAPIWITMEPFPAMVDDLRAVARRIRLATDQTHVASSPIALVVLADRASAYSTTACGEPLDWDCVGEAAGNPWEDIGGDPACGRCPTCVRPDRQRDRTARVSPTRCRATSATSPIQVDDPGFVCVGEAAGAAPCPASALTGGTAIATIQTRPSALDIAVGAVAEMSDTSVADAHPPIR